MKQYSDPHNTQTPLSVLLIGGTDPSGAGLQTDWKVANALQVEATSIVTAVTAQTHEAVIDNGVLAYERVKLQLDSVVNKSFSAIKIGMLGDEGVIKALIEFIHQSTTNVLDTPIILDPVLAASSGSGLLSQPGLHLLLTDLLPLTTLITPNIEELTVLTGLPTNSLGEIEAAAYYLITLGAKSVLVKGGHFKAKSKQQQTQSIDIFVNESEAFYLVGERWQNRKNVRGTGCVFATAVASAISKGYCLNDALVFAKAFISQGIRQSSKIGGEIVGERAKQYTFQFNPMLSTKYFELADFPKLINRDEPTYSTYHFPDCGSMRLGVYPVVDSLEWIKKLVPLGIETIQLRIKDKQPEAVEQDIVSAINFCKDYPVRLFINDYWHLVIKHKAYGIHLGQEDLSRLTSADLKAIADAGCRLGVSTHSYAEVARAHYIKPSYLALGPIFATTSKHMPWIPQGVEAVEEWIGLLAEGYPLVAIGGINLERAKVLKQVGVGSVAMISAITHAASYAEATNELLSLWREG